MKRSLGVFLLATATLFSCQKDNQANEDPFKGMPLDSVMIGEWEAVEISLQLNTVMNNPDSNLFVNILEDTSYQAAHSINYMSNDTYKILFDNSTEALMGIWNLIGDTTLMRIEDNAIYEYRIEREGRSVYQVSTEDLDGDGEKDDFYKAVYEKK